MEAAVGLCLAIWFWYWALWYDGWPRVLYVALAVATTIYDIITFTSPRLRIFLSRLTHRYDLFWNLRGLDQLQIQSAEVILAIQVGHKDRLYCDPRSVPIPIEHPKWLGAAFPCESDTDQTYVLALYAVNDERWYATGVLFDRVPSSQEEAELLKQIFEEEGQEMLRLD